MNTVKYRLPDKPKKTVTAFVLSILSATGDLSLLLVPSFDDERSHAVVIAHDDDSDGIFEDSTANRFNVESKDMIEIADNLKAIGTKLK